MSLYGAVLFLHVITAILLVGGSMWSHVAGAMLARSETVEGARSHASFLQTFSRASGPLAALVLLAGIYMATDAGLWGEAWLVASLVLFLLVGAGAALVVDPSTTRMVRVLDEARAGAMTPAIAGELADPRLTVVLSLFAASDLALVFLMTNKPGLIGSLTVIGAFEAVGALWAARELRAHRVAAPGAVNA